MVKRCLILFFIFSSGCNFLYAQETQRLNICFPDIEFASPLKDTTVINYYGEPDPESKLDSLVEELHDKGFFDASYRWSEQQSEYPCAVVEKGEQYLWIIDSTNVDPNVLKYLSIDPMQGNIKLSNEELGSIKYKIIDYYASNGYPFARISMKNIKIDERVISGKLHVDILDFYVFDQIKLTGDISLSKKFLSTHTGIQQGMAFNDDAVSRSVSLLSDLPFVNIKGEPQLRFSGNTVEIIVPAEHKKANRLDGIAGLSGSGSEADPYKATGYLNLQLINVIEHGEGISLKWQGLGHGTQSLDFGFQYPYILSLPVITEFQFTLHKQDSTFISIGRKPEISFYTPSGIVVSAFADIKSTDLLKPSTFETSHRFPEFIDTRTTYYGIEARKSSPGFLTNLRKGYSMNFSIGAGSRKIKKNSSLDQDFYDDIPSKQNQFMANVNIIYQQPIRRKSTLSFRFESGNLLGKQLFANELYRIGGFNSLKGFDEESIMASSYSILSPEIRFFTGERTYFSLFFNAAWYENNLSGSYSNGWPWGAGAGATIDTPAGILSLYYALGKQPGFPLTFRNARIHFGLISLF